MEENPAPTGGVTPTVSVIKPLNNATETIELPPLLDVEVPQLVENPEEQTSGLPPLETPQTEEKLPELQKPTNQSTFDFGQLSPIVEADNKDTRAKLNQRKTPQELFLPKLESENTQVTPPLDDISKATLNATVNPKLMPNTGQVELGQTGAPIVHKEGELKLLKIADYPTEININPDVQRSLTPFDAQTGFDFLNRGRIPTMSSMSEEQRVTYENILGKDNMPEDKMVYPEIDASKLDEVFSSLSNSDKLLDDNLTKNQSVINDLSEKINSHKGTKDDELKWESLTSKDIYYNIWKSVAGNGEKKDIYPEEVASKVQSIRNGFKYDILKKSGFVGEIPADIPEKIQDFLKSNEYINSTAKQKMLYAKQLWFTNQDKYANPQEFYSKIAKTFTPSISLLFLKQKAKELLPKALQEQKVARHETNYVPLPVRMISSVVGDTPQTKLLEQIIDSDFENDYGALSKIGYSAKHHGRDAIPFLSSVLGLRDSYDIMKIVDKAKKQGVESLYPSEKTYYDAYEMFNTFNQLSQPDQITQAINAAPGIIAFIGELGATSEVRAFTEGMIRAGASKAMKVAIEKSPSIVGSSVNILKAVDGVTGGALKKLAGNGAKLFTYPAGVTSQMLMARGSSAANTAVNMTTDIPTLHLDENDMKYVSEITSTESPDIYQNLLKAAALETANLSALDLGKVLAGAQNSLIGRALSKFEKSSPEYKLIQMLQANEAEGVAQAGGKATGIAAFLERAKALSPASAVPDMLSFGVALPRAEHLILGTKDEMWSNPYKAITNDIQAAAIGLAAPILGGKLIGLGSLVDFKRVIFRNEAKFHDFQSEVFAKSSEEFMREENLDKLRKDINYFSETGDNKKNRLGKLMQARLDHRLAFEKGEIEGAVGETYSEYIENAGKSQGNMNELLEQVKNGDVSPTQLKGFIEEAADAVDRRQFEFHRDLIESYEVAAPEGETLKQYVDKHKKVYFDIKQEFAALQSLRTAPDWVKYEKRIDDSMLPSDYKQELKLTYDYLKSTWEADTQRLYGNKEQNRNIAPEIMSVDTDNTKHTFVKQPDGTYKFSTTDEASVESDIDFRLKSMSIADVLNLNNVSRNSDMTPEQKKSVAKSIKERAISEFEDNEFFSDFGGKENMSQLVDAINEVSQSSPLTAEEKNSLTNAIQNVFEVEIRRDGTLENYNNVKSSIQRLVQNGDIVDLKTVLDFHNKMSKLVMKEAVKNMTNSQLEYEIQTSTGDGAREILTEEVNERKNLGIATGEDLAKLMKMLNLQPIDTAVDFETLKKNNPTVQKLSKTIFELQKLGLVSDKGRSILEGIITAINPEYLNVSKIELNKEGILNGSRYNDKSKSIVISYHDKSTEAELVAEITEELLHSVQHNIGLSLGNGGMIGEFLMTDAQIMEISGGTRTDAVANIARWYRSKDYDYNNFLRLKDMLPSEMTESERAEFYAIKDMLLRFATKYKQKWDALNFIDKENKLGWSFTTESIVRNWSRYNQMKNVARPDGRKYTSAEAFYYSAYSHEYFARALGDFQITDISNRIEGDEKIVTMLDKASNFISKTFKLPIIARLFRGEVFDKNPSLLRDMMSVADERNLEETLTTPGEAFNEQQKKDFDNVLSKIPAEYNHVEHFRNLVNDTSNPQALNDFALQVANVATSLGYDKSITGDIFAYLNKEIGINPVGAYRDAENELRYVSNTMKAVESLKIDKTSGANWLDKILSSGGKKVEIERYALDEYLKSQKSFTKQDILDYLSDKVMKVKEVMLGGEIDKVEAELNKKMEEAKNSLIYYGIDPTGREGNISIERRDGNTVITKMTDNGIEQVYYYPAELVGSVYRGEEKYSIDSANEVFAKANDWLDTYDEWIEYRDNFVGDNEQGTRHSSWTKFPLNNYRELLPVIDSGKELFTSESHFPGIYNQLYHNRLNDVTSESGKKLLLSEEMQGDWAQKEKKNSSLRGQTELMGQKSQVNFWTKRVGAWKERVDSWNKDVSPDNEPQKALDELALKDAEERLDAEKKKLSKIELEQKQKESPLKKTSDWVRASIKRMIALAVSEGKDGIAWTPANIQVERWSNGMRGVVDKIVFYNTAESKTNDFEKEVINTEEEKNGNTVGERAFVFKKPGDIFQGANDFIKEDGWYELDSGKKMEEYYGSEMSKKIQEQKAGELKDKEIIVGGQGFVDVYDKTAVDVANGIAKKYGLEVTKETVKNKEAVTEIKRGETGNEWWYNKEGDRNEVHTLLFNDALKADISKQNEIEIFAKRDKTGEGTTNHEFKNIYDFIKDNNESELYKDKVELHTEERKKLERENPEEYKRIVELEKAEMSEYEKLIVPQEQLDIIKTESENFKNWFGKSKVVDKEGSPLVVYHGTNKEFNAFDKRFLGENTGWSNAKQGFFFIADKTLAENFAREEAGGDIVKPFYLSIKNPIDLRTESIFTNKKNATVIVEILTGEKMSGKKAIEWLDEEIGIGELSELRDELSSDEAKEKFIESGFDGIISHFGDGNAEYVAFEPNQIKHATDNSGKFSSDTDSFIGAKRDDKQSPVDVSWFRTLFEDKDTVVSAKDIEKVIKDLDDNLTNYIDGETIKTLPQARRAASAFANDLLELWKQRLVQKALPKSSTYERKEILRLLTIPVRTKLETYSKDIKYVTDIVENANFRKELADTKKEQGFARNRFLRYNKDDVAFYSAVNKLTSINTRFFEDAKALGEYKELLTSKPENVNVEEFTQKVNDTWSQYQEWKKQFNSKYEATGEGEVAEDESILNEQLFHDKKMLIEEAVRTQLVNKGKSDLDKSYIEDFASINIWDMDEAQVKEYQEALKYLLLNPEDVNHNIVKIVNKYRASDWASKVPDALSKKYVDLINSKALPSSGIVKNLLKGTLPAVSFGYDKLGNLAPYNVTSIFEIAEGMAMDNYGVLRSEITEPINRNYQSFLTNKAEAIRKISAKDKYSIAQMHRIGIKALLDQKPQFGVSANALKVLSEAGIDIEDIAVGDILDSTSTGAKKEAYDHILKSSNEMIKDSILISFGEKPDNEWKDDEMKEILGDVEVMSQRSQSQIKEELAELLKESGYATLREYVDAMADGTHQLTPAEQGYLDLLRSTSNDAAEGAYSNGMTLKNASEKLQGVQFQKIDNYAPLLRYKTYLTTEKYLGEDRDTDAKVFYGIYNDFQMNTSFLEKRKPTVMALETNAYAMFAKRLDQQIYYLNNIEHQNYLKSAFRTPVFYGKGDVFNTEATNQIVEILNGNYNRGVNAARAKLKQDITAKWAYGAMDRYKALAVGDWLKSPSQLSTVIFNMAKMKGNMFGKANDVKQAIPKMVNSYMEGSDENLFLQKHAPEVYFRGLNTYDFMGIDAGDNYTQGTGAAGKSKIERIFSEAGRNSGKASGVMSGLERGMYRTNKSKARVIASEVANQYSQFGTEFNLAGLKFHDRIAARTSFFASYINYCKYKGIDVDYKNPSQEALNFAMESVRETQHSDNPLQRSGLSYGLSGSGTQSSFGDWQMVNMLAFKSYAINERQTLMKASERLKNAIAKGDKQKIVDESSYFAYSFASKVAFNYIKLYCQKYLLAALASQFIGGDSDKKALASGSIGNWAQWQNVGMRSALDYFTLASPLKFAASVGLTMAEATAKDRDLSPEEKEKYGAMNSDFMDSFSGDILDNLVSSGSQIKPTIKNYGFASKEHALEEARFWLLISQMKYGIPGASVGSNLLKEVNKQKKMKERGKSADTEDSGY